MRPARGARRFGALPAFAASAPTLGAGQVLGSASCSWDFATLAAGTYSGTSTYISTLT